VNESGRWKQRASAKKKRKKEKERKENDAHSWWILLRKPPQLRLLRSEDNCDSSQCPGEASPKCSQRWGLMVIAI